MSVTSIALADLTDLEPALLLDAFPNLREIEHAVPRPSLADVVAVGRLGIRRVALYPYAGVDAHQARSFAELLDALQRAKATIDELVLTPPFARWPRPAPIVLHRRDGRYVRTTPPEK